MYRWRLADEPYDKDRFGSWWDDRAQMADSQPRGGSDERYLLRCPVCFKDLAAREDCAACSDEDVAA